jgi:hypothetical protein
MAQKKTFISRGAVPTTTTIPDSEQPLVKRRDLTSPTVKPPHSDLLKVVWDSRRVLFYFVSFRVWRTVDQRKVIATHICIKNDEQRSTDRRT